MFLAARMVNQVADPLITSRVDRSSQSRHDDCPCANCFFVRLRECPYLLSACLCEVPLEGVLERYTFNGHSRMDPAELLTIVGFCSFA